MDINQAQQKLDSLEKFYKQMYILLKGVHSQLTFQDLDLDVRAQLNKLLVKQLPIQNDKLQINTDMSNSDKNYTNEEITSMAQDSLMESNQDIQIPLNQVDDQPVQLYQHLMKPRNNIKRLMKETQSIKQKIQMLKKKLK